MVDNLKEKYPKMYYYLNQSFTSEELLEILNSLETKREYDFIEEKLESGDSYSMCDYFKKSYRDFYGSELLISNYDDLSTYELEEGLMDNRCGEIVKYLLKNNISLKKSYCFLDSPKVDVDFLEKIKPLFDNFYVKRFISQRFTIENDNEKDFFLSAVDEDSIENAILKTIVSKYGEIEQGKCRSLLEIENRENLYKFVELMPDEYFNDKSKMDRFVKLYKKCEGILDSIDVRDISDEKLKKCFKTYILDGNRDEFSINDKDDLLNIFEVRDDYYLNKINKTSSIGKIKSYISQNFFGMRFKKFNDKISEVKNITMNMQTSDEFSMDEYITFSFIAELGYCDTKKRLLGYYEKLRYFWGDSKYSYFDWLNEKIKDIYQRNLVNGLTQLPKGFQVVYYDGEDFEFLTHKVIGLDNKEYARKIILDPEFWKENSKEFIDVSYISEEHFGMAYGNGLNFIFNDIKSNEVVAMGLDDIFSNCNNVCGGVRNLNEEWMLKDDLVANKTSRFDNHVLRKEDGSPAGAFIPNGILCFDEFHERDINAAKVFDVPIVVINREKYLEKINDKVIDAFYKKDSYEYYVKKLQLFMSAFEDRKCVDKYFSESVLEKEVKDFVKDMDVNNVSDLKMLSAMFKTNKKITSALMTYTDMDYCQTDMASVAKKMKTLNK